MTPTTPPHPEGASTALIDCETCPVRGRHCGDCFVPVLGRIWLQTPTATAPEEGAAAAARTADPGAVPAVPERGERVAALDSDELAAVGAFVRAGLVAPEEAAATRAAGAVLDRPRRATG
ncbi:hypothetical protein SGUI_0817 [Serinicoccus hydrothermalis]|uniref:Uncharacterized protein n=1 Tax=Serinicoccus hydrothermalis TaxID=1758689 RepID=A0A1B1N9U7_9MICO|nr:hypothetical protein [Serinicoccus hydrothermalis]ANS78213.1 hypothetical protein SGUI_0817 [Serinicoccus hydrothermalis]